MGEGLHVQMVVDVVVPEGEEPFFRLAHLIELLNAELYRQGFSETAWVARLPESRDLPSDHAPGAP